MNTANISYARNHWSELVNRVRDGETILILDRNTPVARLEPMFHPEEAISKWKADLVRRGLIRPARHRMNLEALSALSVPVTCEGGDILEALQADREEGS